MDLFLRISLGGGPGENPGHAGGTMSLGWPWSAANIWGEAAETAAPATRTQMKQKKMSTRARLKLKPNPKGIKFF